MLTTWMENQKMTQYSAVPLSSMPEQSARLKELLAETQESFAPSAFSKGFLTKSQLQNAQHATVEECYAITIFFPFLSANHNPNGNLPLYAMSLDYHWIVRTLTRSLQQKFEANYPNHFFYAQCDTGPFNERLFAVQSGLCLQGLNALAIHPQYGTFGVLGLFITDLPQEIKRQKRTWCRQCGRCKETCPGQAIVGNGQIDMLRCASYLSQEKKELTFQEAQIIRKSKKAFGCDQCQICCPENINALQTPLPQFSQSVLCSIELGDVEGLTNKEFLAMYGDRAFSWRGRSVLERNLKLLQKDNLSSESNFCQESYEV